MNTLYKVCQDGRAIFRALPRHEAERHATQLAHGYDNKRAGSSIHHPHIEVKVDTDVMSELNETYRWYKANR